jgi:hypothetical protein
MPSVWKLPEECSSKRFSSKSGAAAGTQPHTKSPNEPTTDGPPAESESCFRSGFQNHLAKPVEPAELLAVVSSLAGRKVTTPPDAD